MRSILFFETMLTPKIITLVYWILLLFALMSGLGTIFGGPMSFASFIMGLGIMVVGAIGARIWCELLIVLFKIHENMRKIAEK